MTPWCPELNMCCTQPDQSPQVCTSVIVVAAPHAKTGVGCQKMIKLAAVTRKNIPQIRILLAVNILYLRIHHTKSKDQVLPSFFSYSTSDFHVTDVSSI